MKKFVKPPPKGPTIIGSTTESANAVPTAASKAFPPEERIDIPTDEATGWLEVTIPCDADIDCFRVIKSIELKYNN